MKQGTRTPRAKALFVFAAFVVLVLAIMNASGWASWHFTNELISGLLDRHLLSLTMLVSQQLDGEALMRLRPGEEKTATSQKLHELLARHRTQFGLADLYVFDAENRLLASAAPDTKIGSENAALELDRDEILDAWMGRPGISPVISRGGNMLKTGYAPVLVRGGRIAAILAAETDVRFFDMLATLRNAFFVATGLAIVCIGSLALLLWRLLRQLLVAEERHQEMERLALVGRMSAQICHEIRNPLAVMSSSTEFVVRKLKKLGVEDQTVHELAGYIMSEIDRLSDILTRFLDVARKPVLDRRESPLEELIGPLVALVRSDLEKSGIEFDTRLEGASAIVDMDIGSLRQVLLNAILNARDALSDAPCKRLTLTVDRLADDRIAVRVEDTGKGVSPEVLAEAFEPFVTTKAHGTGLGLFIAKRIVEEHEGSVRLENLDDGGTRFVMELPVRAADTVSAD